MGLPNNIEFLIKTVKHPAFVAGGVDTSFLVRPAVEYRMSSALTLPVILVSQGKHLAECLPVPAQAPPAAVALAAFTTVVRQEVEAKGKAVQIGSGDAFSPWFAGKIVFQCSGVC